VLCGAIEEGENKSEGLGKVFKTFNIHFVLTEVVTNNFGATFVRIIKHGVAKQVFFKYNHLFPILEEEVIPCQLGKKFCSFCKAKD